MSLLLETQTGPPLFIKYHKGASRDFFSTEAANLNALREATSLRLPTVIAHNEYCLALEYLGNGDKTPQYWPSLAEGLAELHRTPRECFGFDYDNYCGSTPQPNPRCDDGFSFFTQQRLGQQIDLAVSQSLLDHQDQQKLDELILKLPTLLPDAPPVLLHGDLWSGNVHCDSQGQPCLIDPACYWGWREADIAMTTLFGGFPEQFYQHYQHCLPMPKGWQQRLPLYNLYHLLNHLNLFGDQYRSSIKQLIIRYC